MSFFGPDSYPGDGCDTNDPAYQRPARGDDTMADLPEHIMIMLMDSEVPHLLKPLVSRLIADAGRFYYADGKADGIQAVIEDPMSYFDFERDEP